MSGAFSQWGQGLPDKDRQLLALANPGMYGAAMGPPPGSINPNANPYGPAFPQGGPAAAPVGPPMPGTPYTGPKPYIAGAYNTLAPNDYAAYQASLQPVGPGGVTAPQQLPGLMDDNAAQIAQAKRLFDNPNGYWSGGEGSGGNGGGQR